MYKFHILTCVVLKPSVAGVVIAAVFSVASGSRVALGYGNGFLIVTVSRFINVFSPT